MSIEEITAFIESLGGVLTLRPGPGDGSPEIAWGDSFFYYAPDGAAPATGQPFATIVTKDYPGDDTSRLDRPGAFRVNIAATRDVVRARTDRDPAADSSAPDTVLVHPVYGSAGWLAVVDPGPRTRDAIRDLLRDAHGRARTRYDRAHPSDRYPRTL